MTEMIALTRLTKHFGPLKAVDGIDLSVAKGEVLGFLGPNGAGKSTTMKMVTGFLTPTDGEALVDGINVVQDPVAAKRRIGYLPEGAPCYGDMTPSSFLGFIAEVRGLSGAERRRAIDQAVERVEIGGVLQQPIERLSKGFKRRVGLAQALLHDPDVLILDEPTDGLDPNQKHEVRELIREIAPEKAIIISTHILEEVDAICSRAVIIANGKVIADGAPGELAQRSEIFNAVAVMLSKDVAERARAALQPLDAVKEIRALSQADGQAKLIVAPKDGAMILNTVAGALADAGVDVISVRPEASALEDLFRHLTLNGEAA